MTLAALAASVFGALFMQWAFKWIAPRRKPRYAEAFATQAVVNAIMLCVMYATWAAVARLESSGSVQSGALDAVFPALVPVGFIVCAFVVQRRHTLGFGAAALVTLAVFALGLALGMMAWVAAAMLFREV